jgi:8-oxo-dGTP diphosphatase
LHFQDHYLFVHRTKKGNKTDADRLNGIGGKLEIGEDFLSAAIRETQEETGLIVDADAVQLKAIVSMTGGYPENWVMCFFSIAVASMELPNGMENDEGELIWLKQDEVLTTEYELVDDLHYCWPHLVNTDKRVLYAGCIIDEKQAVSQWHSRLL